MGYSYENGGQIKNFWPDDDENTIYIASYSGKTLDSILELIKDKWGDIPLSSIEISSENIHTHCLTYDSYDSSDYTNFTVITKTE